MSPMSPALIPRKVTVVTLVMTPSPLSPQAHNSQSKTPSFLLMKGNVTPAGEVTMVTPSPPLNVGVWVPDSATQTHLA